MDNLSHALAGLAAAELVHRSLPAEPDADRHRTRHRLLLVACALASNFPDLDLFLTPFLPEPLGYLLHHRGHTHTILYAIPQALFLSALLWLLWPEARALLRQSLPARAGVVAVMVAGFGLHLAMDYLNFYGIHPFHPVDSRWLYGDMMFIIEPVFWVALGVPLIGLIGHAVLRIGLLVLLAAVLAYFTIGGYLHWASLLALYALGVALVLLHACRRAGSAAIVAGVGMLCVFILIQGIASRNAAERIAAALADMDGASILRDSALSPFPSNPLCWTFVSVESDEAGGRLRLRRGLFALTPGLLPVNGCPSVLAGGGVPQRLNPALALVAQHEGSLTELRRLARENCHFNAWLRFARAPQLDQGVASDMRFSSSPRGNFTTLDLDTFRGRDCPRHVPQWAFPRADLLEPG